MTIENCYICLPKYRWWKQSISPKLRMTIENCYICLPKYRLWKQSISPKLRMTIENCYNYIFAEILMKTINIAQAPNTFRLCRYQPGDGHQSVWHSQYPAISEHAQVLEREASRAETAGPHRPVPQQIIQEEQPQDHWSPVAEVDPSGRGHHLGWYPCYHERIIASVCTILLKGCAERSLLW